jgi:hypothetical protein
MHGSLRSPSALTWSRRMEPMKTGSRLEHQTRPCIEPHHGRPQRSRDLALL